MNEERENEAANDRLSKFLPRKNLRRNQLIKRYLKILMKGFLLKFWGPLQKLAIIMPSVRDTSVTPKITQTTDQSAQWLYFTTQNSSWNFTVATVLVRALY
jgi:hypothetical protein